VDEITQLSGQLSELAYALDTFYFLVMGALVMWMAAGFTMLEAGLVRAKNTAEILTKNVGLYSIASIMYMACGYSIMYPGDFAGGVFQSLSTFGSGMLGSTDNDPASVIAGDAYYSNLSDFFFQVVFVATAMSIVSGAVAERMKLWAFFLFAVFLTGFIYPVQGFWKWGGGFLDTMGFLDFAGSGVVHLCGAAAALAGVLLLGARKGKYGKKGQINAIPGCNLPLATLGTLILWLGWFGFNGGSELKVSDVSEANSVALVFVNTNMAAAGGLILALLVSRMWFGKADLTMALNGALAGLVAITAEPLTPTRRTNRRRLHCGSGQAQGGRSGRCDLGSRCRRHLGLVSCRIYQQQRQFLGPAWYPVHRSRDDIRLGLHYELHCLVRDQAHHGYPRVCRGRIRGRRYLGMRS